jgi:hypothetical protein
LAGSGVVLLIPKVAVLSAMRLTRGRVNDIYNLFAERG